MRPDLVPEMHTLGARLEAAARRLQQARSHVPPWWGLLAQGPARAAQRLTFAAERFERVEATQLHRIDEATAPPAGGTEALPDGVRRQLRSLVGPAADRMRVHAGDAADAVARGHDADALSIGADVYFARGKFKPYERDGLALLAHEAVHVAHALRSGATWQRGGAADLAAEEGQARALEQAQRRLATEASPPVAGGGLPVPVPQQVLASTTAATAARQPMAAAVDRGLGSPTTPSPIDLEALRQSLMRELMGRIRAEMERGG